MQTRRITVAVVVFLGIAALAASAASMQTQPAGGESGTGIGSGGGTAEGILQGVTRSFGMPGWLVENYIATAFLGGTVFLVLFAGAVVARDGLAGLKRLLTLAADVGLGGLIWVLFHVAGLLLVWLFMTDNSVRDQSSPGVATPTGGSSAEAAQAASSTGGSGMVQLLLVLAAIVSVSVGLFYLANRRDADETSDDGDGADAEAAAVEPGGDAGSTQTVRIEDVEPTNPVYAAWLDLTDRAGLSDRATTTPAEVADRAVERGLDREAVTTITRLFEEVRYGHRGPEERADRARSALQRLDAGGER